MRLNAGSFAGAMATVTELAGRTNLTGGADLSLNFKGANSLNGVRPRLEHDRWRRRGSGIGLQANYGFSSRRVTCRPKSSTTAATS